MTSYYALIKERHDMGFFSLEGSSLQEAQEFFAQSLLYSEGYRYFAESRIDEITILEVSASTTIDIAPLIQEYERVQRANIEAKRLHREYREYERLKVEFGEGVK